VPSGSAKRYAKAVFELAQEAGETEAWAERLRTLDAIISPPEVQAVLSNPSIPAARRLGLVSGLASDELGVEGLNLAKLLVEANRAHEIGDVAHQYELLNDEAAGRVRATATTAVELSSADRDRIARDLSTRLGKEVKLEVVVDPAILGGLRLQVGDHLVDASVAGHLQQLRRQLAAS
jgi:F-type H+-transporting ATPase subunit delta